MAVLSPLISGLVLVGASLLPLVAFAQPAVPADRALATDLFNQARALVADAKVSEACPKFAESQRLDPSLGTLLNLANCHELEGKTATAWSEFTEALAVAERERQPDRVAFAEAHVQRLALRLPRLVIVVPPELEGSDFEVTRDGSSIARVALGTAMPIDPGTHRIGIKASGFSPWSVDIEIVEGARRELTVGPLAPLVPEPTPLAPVVADQAPVPVPPPVAAEPPPPAGRTVGLALGGTGLLAFGVGAVAGILAISKSSESDSLCSPRCNEEGYSLNQGARTAADVATVSFIVGAVALSAGVFLYVTSGPSSRARSAGILDGAFRTLRF